VSVTVANTGQRAGAEVVELPLPPSFAFVIPAWDIIKQAEHILINPTFLILYSMFEHYANKNHVIIFIFIQY
jgi:hypothetical protein